MSIREAMQRHSGITTAITLVVTLVAIGYLVFFLSTSRSPGQAAKQAYFTTDDGATWFADDINLLPPFTKDGKEAVRAYIFRCDGGKPFVAYLMRFTPEAKKTLEDAKAKNAGALDAQLLLGMERSQSEAKKPGNDRWAHASRERRQYDEATRLGCPDGNMAGLEMVMP